MTTSKPSSKYKSNYDYAFGGKPIKKVKCVCSPDKEKECRCFSCGCKGKCRWTKKKMSEERKRKVMQDVANNLNKRLRRRGEEGEFIVDENNELVREDPPTLISVVEKWISGLFGV